MYKRMHARACMCACMCGVHVPVHDYHIKHISHTVLVTNKGSQRCFEPSHVLLNLSPAP